MGFRHIQRFAHYHGLVSTAGFGSGTRTPSIRCSHFSRPRSTIFKHWKSHIAYRNPKFAVLTSDHIKSLQKLLEDDPIAVLDASVQGQSDLDTYNVDWMRKYQGQSQLVLRPRSTSQVSRVLKYCNEHSLAVVPQGGNTGLVGGSVPRFDEIIISMSRMNEIRSFDEISGALIVDGGVVLEQADNYLADRGYTFPLDLGAKGSCHVAGTFATNAGGLRLLRFGSLRGSAMGIEAVLPDGTILNDLLRVRKNNTGYDLKQLFIGAEGTLGIITAVSILCPRRSTSVNLAYLGVSSYEKVQKIFVEAKAKLGEILSAFELMDGRSQDFVHRKTGKPSPLNDKHDFYCVIETSGSNSESDSARVERFLEQVLSEELADDGVLAQDESQKKSLWAWREGITEALSHWGGTYKYDMSLPLEDLYRLVEDCRTQLQQKGLLSGFDENDQNCPAIDVVGYGHMGDGNIHLNIPVRRYAKEVENALEPWVYEWVSRRQGSISAEHGLGIAKNNYIGYTRDEVTIGLMKGIKGLWDPKGIMNPYKYFPTTTFTTSADGSQ
jgi:(R)-2-hydroxyglutarate---pyruvate transhydrogenase